MSISNETAFKLDCAVEMLATSSGSDLQRAQRAQPQLIGIRGDEFSGNVAGVPWSYISSVSKDIQSGSATEEVASRFNSSIWQLFQCYRLKR